jgi:hypothetical protein
VVLVAFVNFYPILFAQPITYSVWHNRMSPRTWIVGPG